MSEPGMRSRANKQIKEKSKAISNKKKQAKSKTQETPKTLGAVRTKVHKVTKQTGKDSEEHKNLNTQG